MLKSIAIVNSFITKRYFLSRLCRVQKQREYLIELDHTDIFLTQPTSKLPKKKKFIFFLSYFVGDQSWLCTLQSAQSWLISS
jgi:hypothetical protein